MVDIAELREKIVLLEKSFGSIIPNLSYKAVNGLLISLYLETIENFNKIMEATQSNIRIKITEIDIE